jgi:Asp-tRNA(Asn)/Glu-tRNA(Gln) amidotransferase A subunit family amidase
MDNDRMTIDEVHSKYKSGELDLIEWNKTFIDLIQEKENKIQAWVYFDKDQWLENCVNILSNKPKFEKLLGVPVGVKDIFNTNDMPTAMGSPIWKDFTPGNDARVIYDIKMNGGFSAGKTVTAEFAVHTPNETRNPWNLEKSPGTSSSGSAAAVACGMVPLSLGTQTAGSIIRPASYCGVFGYKPTFGTVPRTGMLKTTDSLDTIGLFATNIDDCKLLFDVIRVKGLDYPIVNEKLNNEKFQSPLIGKWKIGVVMEQHPVTKNYEKYATDQFNSLVSQLKSSKVLEIVYPRLPALINQAHQIQEKIYHKALSYYFKKEFENHTLISDVMYEIIQQGNQITTTEYQEAVKLQNTLSQQVNEIFENVDILITLSTSATAPDFKTAIDPPDTCLIWTMCGCPTVNIPCFENSGMPFGLQVIAAKYADYKLIRFIKDLTDKLIFPKFSIIK